MVCAHINIIKFDLKIMSIFYDSSDFIDNRTDRMHSIECTCKSLKHKFIKCIGSIKKIIISASISSTTFITLVADSLLLRIKSSYISASSQQSLLKVFRSYRIRRTGLFIRLVDEMQLQASTCRIGIRNSFLLDILFSRMRRISQDPLQFLHY